MHLQWHLKHVVVLPQFSLINCVAIAANRNMRSLWPKRSSCSFLGDKPLVFARIAARFFMQSLLQNEWHPNMCFAIEVRFEIASRSASIFPTIQMLNVNRALKLKEQYVCSSNIFLPPVVPMFYSVFTVFLTKDAGVVQG